MRTIRIKNRVSSIPVEKLVAHPESPNRMSKGSFAKLVRNIERTGRYEPLVVRPCPRRDGFFQIINGHHRCQALCDLGYKSAEAIIWDLDDLDADMLLAGMNRLRGSDVLDKKIALLCRLTGQANAVELARYLPLTRVQIERLTGIDVRRLSRAQPAKTEYAAPLVFFVSDEQKKTIERALSFAREKSTGKTAAAKNAAALTSIAERFNRRPGTRRDNNEDRADAISHLK